ncbi:MAG: mandelate racemase/muconate lactonizing protein [Bryobacterales bacterium]|nr:mandelate racemase/muconate lactonizing protein [Bryobacterales bacterium]
MKITDIIARPHTLTVDPAIAIRSSLGHHRVSRYVLVTVQTDAGIEGYGEATVMPVWSGETQESATAAIRDILAPALTGHDARDVSAALATMDRVIHGNPFTKAAVEMALLDAVGKSTGAPVWQLLGGRRRDTGIWLKMSIGAFAPDDAARVALYAKSHGLRGCKVKVGTDVAADLDRVAAVRDAVGPDFRVGVDANGGWCEAECVAALRGLERLGVNMIEQPLPRGGAEFRACARIRQRTHIPLMLDESIFTKEEALEAIRQDACDIVSIYPGKNGGMLRSLQIALLADAAGLECVIGSNLEWDLASSAMAQVAVAIPNLSERVDHDIIGTLYHRQPVTDPPLRIAEGRAWVPEGPGLGLKL